MFGRKRDDDDVYYGVTSQDRRTRFFQHKNKKNRRGEESRARKVIEKHNLGPEDMKIIKTGMTGEEAADWEQKRSPEPSNRGIKKDNETVYSGYVIRPSLTKRLKRIFGIGPG